MTAASALLAQSSSLPDTPPLAVLPGCACPPSWCGVANHELLAEACVKSHPDTGITVLPSIGSGGGIKAVLSGVLQIGLGARPLTENEVKAGAVTVEYGRAPLVFASSTTTKTSDLTTQVLIDIYAGKMEQWSDGAKIRLLLRPIGDSDSELIGNRSPAMREATRAAGQRKGMAFAVTDRDAASDIARIPGAAHLPGGHP